MLQEYHYCIIHKPSSQNDRADALSHQEELQGGEELMEAVVVLQNTKVIGTPLHSRIIQKDIQTGNRWTVPVHLQSEVMRLFHDHLGAGHPGQTRTWLRIREHYI